MKTDSEIKKDVLSELLWDPLVAETKVGVTVNEGVVTLTGDLAWNFQRRAVERIQGALTLQVLREARRIEVSVEDSEVTLRCQVHSWAERNAAEGATWSVPGVTCVNNQLTVEA